MVDINQLNINQLNINQLNINRRGMDLTRLWLKTEQERQHNYLKDGPYITAEEAGLYVGHTNV